jgi:hypothetical protein
LQQETDNESRATQQPLPTSHFLPDEKLASHVIHFSSMAPKEKETTNPVESIALQNIVSKNDDNDEDEDEDEDEDDDFGLVIESSELSSEHGVMPNTIVGASIPTTSSTSSTSSISSKRLKNFTSTLSSSAARLSVQPVHQPWIVRSAQSSAIHDSLLSTSPSATPSVPSSIANAAAARAAARAAGGGDMNPSAATTTTTTTDDLR